MDNVTLKIILLKIYGSFLFIEDLVVWQIALFFPGFVCWIASEFIMVFPKHQRPQICREYEENVSSSSWWSLKCGKIFPLLAWSSMRILFKVHVCMAIISVNSDWTQVMVLFLSCRSFLKLYSSEINLIDCFKLYLVLDLLSSSVLFFFFQFLY